MKRNNLTAKIGVSTVWQRLIKSGKTSVTGLPYSYYIVQNAMNGKTYDPNVEAEVLSIEAELANNKKAAQLIAQAKKLLNAQMQ
jgi:hypothetical protein